MAVEPGRDKFSDKNAFNRRSDQNVIELAPYVEGSSNSPPIGVLRSNCHHNAMNKSYLPASDAALRKLDKQIQKEAKLKDSTVKHSVKDLASTENRVKKVDKGLGKARKTLAKREKEELSAVKALNKATHQHNMAIAKAADARHIMYVTNVGLMEWPLPTITREAQEAKIADLQAGTGGTVNHQKIQGFSTTPPRRIDMRYLYRG
ncbi:uncharacterized protein BT62DRAFT_1006112 [Guyanagaster necrorhizus]|uniref:Uncharacterized protein n=1 Tax=Guyanagaster necrorhizus TaxID=856835 RepID=A0A9P7VSK2_9AGAR|nr:uncharacterized protein BT62DRAFT_1006112 [Guyanagaster necrorhizus MCA 3950]KAG7445930.1 hypothetical protein BT62DRAFT_1006112 [Guyanagaster necrorhizus MCA 3950]